MGHKIGSMDTGMAAEKNGWHDLFKVLNRAPTPEIALIESGLNWRVAQDQLFRSRDGSLCSTHVENFREHDGLSLGVVGRGYKPVQNDELFNMVYGVLGERKELEVETAFSMCNCRRIVVTVRADAFLPQKDDPVKMYLCFANGHDMSLSLCGYFTSTRVVCNNTFRASQAAAKKSEGFVSLKHEGDMGAKMEEAEHILAAYAATYRDYQLKVSALVNRKMTRDEVNDLVTEAIVLMERDIPTEADACKSSRAHTKRLKCVKAYKVIIDNFDREAAQIKADRNAWMIFNACTKWFQHDRPMRGKDEEKKVSDRLFSDNFGQIAGAKSKLWESALALV